MSAVLPSANRTVATAKEDVLIDPPSWLVGLCGVAAVASLLFTALLLLDL